MPQFRPLSETKFINDANLVSYWKLEDVNDSKGSNNLTNNGTVTFDAARFGNGATINPTGSKYLSITDANQTGLGVTGSFSVSMWVKLAGQPAANGYFSLFVKESSGKRAYQINYRNISSVPQFENYIFADSTPTNYSFTNALQALTNGVWYHLVFVQEPSAALQSKFSIYVNGAKISDTEQNAGTGCSTITTSTSPVNIGANNGANITNGIIDDTAFFSRALTSAEVNELYQGMTLGEYLGAGSSTTKLLLHLNGSSSDSSGNGNNGTDTGIDYGQAYGKFGQGALFNATADKILIANESQFDFERTDSFTLSCWTKINATNTTAIIIAKQVASGNFTGYALYRLYSAGTNYLEFGVLNTPTNACIVTTQDNITFPNTTDWHNIIATYDGSSSTSGLKIYLNGVSLTLTSTTNALTSSILNNVQLEIGNRNGALNYNGSIDEVIVENVAWSASQVKKYFTYAKGRFGII